MAEKLEAVIVASLDTSNLQKGVDVARDTLKPL
jgi:hypothetical protein